MKNPSLSDLVGGISSVTLGDEEAKRRGVQKSVLERQVGGGNGLSGERDHQALGWLAVVWHSEWGEGAAAGADWDAVVQHMDP